MSKWAMGRSCSIVPVICFWFQECLAKILRAGAYLPLPGYDRYVPNLLFCFSEHLHPEKEGEWYWWEMDLLILMTRSRIVLRWEFLRDRKNRAGNGKTWEHTWLNPHFPTNTITNSNAGSWKPISCWFSGEHDGYDHCVGRRWTEWGIFPDN